MTISARRMQNALLLGKWRGDDCQQTPRSTRFRRLDARLRVALTTPAWVSAAPICCNPVDEIHRRCRRQHEPAGGIAAPGAWRVCLDFVEARDAKFNTQCLPIEDEAG